MPIVVYVQEETRPAPPPAYYNAALTKATPTADTNLRGGNAGESLDNLQIKSEDYGVQTASDYYQKGLEDLISKIVKLEIPSGGYKELLIRQLDVSTLSNIERAAVLVLLDRKQVQSTMDCIRKEKDNGITEEQSAQLKAYTKIGMSEYYHYISTKIDIETLTANNRADPKMSQLREANEHYATVLSKKTTGNPAVPIPELTQIVAILTQNREKLNDFSLKCWANAKISRNENYQDIVQVLNPMLVPATEAEVLQKISLEALMMTAGDMRQFFANVAAAAYASPFVEDKMIFGRALVSGDYRTYNEKMKNPMEATDTLKEDMRNLMVDAKKPLGEKDAQYITRVFATVKLIMHTARVNSANASN